MEEEKSLPQLFPRRKDLPCGDDCSISIIISQPLFACFFTGGDPRSPGVKASGVDLNTSCNAETEAVPRAACAAPTLGNTHHPPAPGCKEGRAPECGLELGYAIPISKPQHSEERSLAVKDNGNLMLNSSDVLPKCVFCYYGGGLLQSEMSIYA